MTTVEQLRERDSRLNAWLETVSPGDIVTVRLNSTDTLTGKVYEAPDAGGTSLCVWTTVLRHGNGYPGGSYEPVLEDEEVHELDRHGMKCTCGWEPKLGESVMRAFDLHLLDVR